MIRGLSPNDVVELDQKVRRRIRGDLAVLNGLNQRRDILPAGSRKR